MSTHGHLQIAEEGGAHFVDKPHLLEATHDGLVSRTLREFLTLPYSVFHQSKWEYLNFHKSYENAARSDEQMDMEDVDPPFLASNTGGFHFYWAMRRYVGGKEGFPVIFRWWRNVHFLDLFQERYMSLFLWQTPNKWIPTVNGEPDSTVVVGEGHLPEVTFICDTEPHSLQQNFEQRHGYLDEPDIPDDLPDFVENKVDTGCALPSSQVEDGKLKVTMNIDLIVCFLLWEDFTND